MRYAAPILLFALPAVGVAQAPEPETPTVVVTGSSTQTVPPDMVTVSFSASRVEDSPGDAVDGTAELAEAVISALGAMGLADLEIERIGLAVSPHWEHKRNGDREFKGYRANTTVRARTHILGETGRLVNAGTDAGATIGGVGYSSSSEMHALRRLALASAVAAAREDAAAMAEAAGGRLGPLLLLTTDRLDPAPGIGPVAIQALRAGDTFMLDPQNVAVSARVQGRWEFIPDGN
ncbi:MAG: SIMPL domain-containing protein [Gemmatimonadota bacterium]